MAPRALLRHLRLFWAFILVIGCGSETEESVVEMLDASMADATIEERIRPVVRFSPADILTSTPLGMVPFPNEIYINDAGFFQIDTFPYNTNGSFINRVLTSLNENVRGFGCVSTHYISFESELDTSLLPEDGQASLSSESALLLVNIDPGSPYFGQKTPLRWRYNADETVYLPANTLAVRAVEGIALEPDTLYMLAVDERISQTTPEFEAVLSPTAPSGREELWNVYAPVRDYLTDADFRPAVASVFRTMNPVIEMFELRDYIDQLEPPEAEDVERSSSFPGLYTEYVGTYNAPNFQRGEPPFILSGGDFEYDTNGDPVIQRQETLRFSISIPSEFEMPEAGWPIVMYGHGTGGDYKSYIGSGAAASLARVGIATIGIDQVHHGPRDIRENNCDSDRDPATCVSSLFFNFLNPPAGRDNVRQSAADFVSLARMLRNRTIVVNVPTSDPMVEDPENDAAENEGQEADLDMGVSMPDASITAADNTSDAGLDIESDMAVTDAETDMAETDVATGMTVIDAGIPSSDEDTGGFDVGVTSMDAMVTPNQPDEPDESTEPLVFRFDPNGILYLGHSQGGVNGPLFLAIDENVKGGMLSAAGGNIAITLEQKTLPIDIAAFAAMFVTLGDNETLDRWHPLFMLVQTFIEPGDPINYARFWFDRPREGSLPKSIFMTAGMNDQYTPPESIFALAAAGRVPIIPPVEEPIELNTLLDIDPSGVPPYPANVADGEAAAGLLQLPNVGHFVFQRDITIRNRYKQFFKSVVDGQPQIY